MVAQGRAPAWGGTPHSCSPSAGGKRPRLVSPCPPPTVQEAATEGAERPSQREPAPRFRLRSVLGAGRRDSTRGVGHPGGSRGPATTCLCWLSNSACVTLPSWPGQVHVPHPPCSPGRELPGDVGDEQLGVQAPWQSGSCPVGPASQFQELTGVSAGRERGGGEDGAARVPCRLPSSTPATACSLSGSLPAVRSRGFTPYLSTHSCLPLPPHLTRSAKKTQ